MAHRSEWSALRSTYMIGVCQTSNRNAFFVTLVWCCILLQHQTSFLFSFWDQIWPKTTFCVFVHARALLTPKLHLRKTYLCLICVRTVNYQHCLDKSRSFIPDRSFIWRVQNVKNTDSGDAVDKNAKIDVRTMACLRKEIAVPFQWRCSAQPPSVPNI